MGEPTKSNKQVNISRQAEKEAIAGITRTESTSIGFHLPANMQLTAQKKHELK